MLILIQPHDDVPKTLSFGRLIPILTALLAEHNAAVAEPELRMRLRAVVHAGEVHDDTGGSTATTSTSRSGCWKRRR